jgi:hypothetical protein
VQMARLRGLFLRFIPSALLRTVQDILCNRRMWIDRYHPCSLFVDLNKELWIWAIFLRLCLPILLVLTFYHLEFFVRHCVFCHWHICSSSGKVPRTAIIPALKQSCRSKGKRVTVPRTTRGGKTRAPNEGKIVFTFKEIRDQG